MLQALGRPLRSDACCPTLFRYPGPCGLQALFGGGRFELGRPGGPLLFLAARPLHADVRGASHFGTIALLEPLRAAPVRTHRRGIHVGLNRPLPELGGLVWVPPTALRAELAWDRVRTTAQARRLFGRGFADERARVVHRLHAYLEELSLLERAGAPPPPRPWCELPRRERALRLSQAGARPTWSGRLDRVARA
jgi:hypothetical protein